MIPRCGGEVATVEAGAFTLAHITPEYERRMPSRMAAEGDRLVFIDGEIYDFPAIPGCTSPETTAVSVLTHLVGSCDFEPLTGIDGTYNIIYWDGPAGRLHILSDFFGYKQLFHQTIDGRFRISSELKSLLALYDSANDLDYHGVSDLFCYSHLLGDRTLFKSIARIPSNSLTIIDAAAGDITVRRFARPRPEMIDTIMVDRAYYERVDEEMQRIFTLQSRLPGKTCLFLSGGLDSRLIAGGLRRANASFASMTYGQSFSLDVKYAAAIAAATGSKWQFIDFTPDHFIDGFEYGLIRSEGMINGIHFLPCGFLDQVAPGSQVSLDGIIMDWLAGLNYKFMPASAVGRRPQKIPGRIFNDMFKVIHPAYEEILFDRQFMDTMRRFRELDDEYFFADFADNINDIAITNYAFDNRVRRLISVNSYCLRADYFLVRYPFVSKKLYQLFMPLPADLKMTKDFYRCYIARYFPQLAEIPWQETGRPLTEEASPARAARRKRKELLRYYLRRLTGGFIDLKNPKDPAHYEQWLRHDKKFRAYFLDIVNSRACRERSIYNKGGIDRLLRIQKNGQYLFEVIAGIVTFELFNRLICKRSRTKGRGDLAESQ